MCKLAKKGNSFDNTRKQWRADSGSGSKYREYSWDSTFEEKPGFKHCKDYKAPTNCERHLLTHSI